MLPATLVQIHYHLRRGGVRRVMLDYATAFSRVNPAGVNVFLTSPSFDGSLPENVRLLTLGDLEYQDFNDSDDLRIAARSIQKRLMDLLDDPSIPRPMTLLAHNGNLAKNLALSAAIAHCANLCSARSDVLFVNIVHDCAEEGRPDRMGQIVRFEEMGFSAREWIWAPIRQVAINRRNERILREAGFSASWLPNRLDPAAEIDKSEESALSVSMKSLFEEDGVFAVPDAPTYLYPVRVIRRKNVVEAILLAVIVKGGILLLGGPGTSAPDQTLYRLLQDLTKRLRLPVLFAADRILLKAGIAGGHGLAPLYALSDAVLSTATAEGFGYGLYEPWLFDTQVIGRMPHGVEEDHLADFSHLYTELLLPENPLFPEYAGVDFSTIPVHDQCRILEAAATDSSFAELLVCYWMPQIPCSQSVNENRQKLQGVLSGDAWDDRFCQILAAEGPVPPGNPLQIARALAVSK